MAKEKKTKTKKWIKFRHKVVRALAWVAFLPSIKFKFRAKIDKYKNDKKKRYLILYNHQTVFDQFFVAFAFSGTIYYVASEDIFSNGIVSKLLRYAVAPIPIKKQTNDIRAVMTCLKVAKEGGSIAIAPEGNRTYSGKTCYFKPSIVKMAKALKLPIAIFRVEDGYGVQPRWADDVRKGGLHAYVKRVIEPEEFLKMSDSELHTVIKEELYVDESAPNKEFYHKNLAQYLERAVYYCPDCGLSVFESDKDLVKCKKCGKVVRYLPNKQFEGVGFDFKYKNVAEWYEDQSRFMNSLDLDKLPDEPLYQDDASVFEVVLYKKKVVIAKMAKIILFPNRIEVECESQKFVFDFEKTEAVTVLGRNKANVYYDGKVYQFKGNERMNALKYVHFFNRYKNTHGGEDDGFLGL